ncbi:terminase gpA endonuclease subunit [Escherichia coli]
MTFHIWTAYSPFTTWVQIVKDWMKTKGDTGKRKTFVNTTLGETWEAKIGERPDAEVMAERKEHYSAPVPDRVAYLTAGIDSQLDRYEMRVWGWGPGEESWLIDRQIIMGRHDDEQTLLRVDEAINKTYTRRNGAEMSISRICWDTGGIDPTIVYERSKKHGLFRVIPIKGMYGDTAIVVYSGQYVENDVKKNFLPDNTMVLGNTQARGLRTYGCIQDADAQREGINASARYPKNWVTTGDPAREFTMIQSAPLMLLADPDAFVSVQLA